MSTVGYTLTPNSAARLKTLIDRLVQITATSSIAPLAFEIRRTYRQEPEPLDPRNIIAFVVAKAAETMGVPGADLTIKSRTAVTKELHHARFLAMYWLYHCVRLSTTQIALVMRRKDHTTAMHGRDRMAELIAENPDVAARVAAVEPEIRQAVSEWRKRSQ